MSYEQQPESHHQIIKAADTLSAYLKCLSELCAGNLEFSITTSELEQKLNDSALPQVGYFMQTFVLACALPSRWYFRRSTCCITISLMLDKRKHFKINVIVQKTLWQVLLMAIIP